MGVVDVGVVGFRWACWKCKETVRCVVGPYRYGDKEIPLGDRALEIARQILNEAGKTDLAAQLVPSRYANGSRGELASHCAGCGAVQGNHYVHEWKVSPVRRLGCRLTRRSRGRCAAG